VTDRVPLRIMGVDGASQLLGWALLEVGGPPDPRSQGRVRHLDSGWFRARGGTKYGRFASIDFELTRLFKRHRPKLVAIENGFVRMGPRGNVQGALVLAESRGVCMVAAARLGLEILEVTPGQAKKAVTGNGFADKLTVQRFVRALFRLEGELQEDQADAIAIAFSAASKGPRTDAGNR